MQARRVDRVACLSSRCISHLLPQACRVLFAVGDVYASLSNILCSLGLMLIMLAQQAWLTPENGQEGTIPCSRQMGMLSCPSTAEHLRRSDAGSYCKAGLHNHHQLGGSDATKDFCPIGIFFLGIYSDASSSVAPADLADSPGCSHALYERQAAAHSRSFPTHLLSSS